jgi:hypothetical protein
MLHLFRWCILFQGSFNGCNVLLRNSDQRLLMALVRCVNACLDESQQGEHVLVGLLIHD